MHAALRCQQAPTGYDEGTEMNEDRLEKRKAYEAAKTHQRAYQERYYPVKVLGGRAAEAVTPEVLVEIDRLKAASEAARVAWEDARSS